MIRKWFFAWMGMTLFAAGAQAAHFGEVVSTSDSQAFFVDSRIVSYRTLGPNDRSVNITYSGYNWDTTGSAGKTATVTLDDEETLKSATGEGVVVWHPKTAETHTFKHACNGATQIATFIVEGPVVTIERVKTGTNANTFYCKINCEPSDAVIHYTTDGSRPTTASAVYTGPFVVDPIHGSVVQAMAVVETGLESRPVAVNFAPLGLELVASSASAEFSVDGRAGTGEALASGGEEGLAYSTRWDGGATAKVTIAENGAAIAADLTDEGVRPWSARKDGTYVLTHTTYTNGVKGKVETATFVVSGLEVPIGDLTVTWDSSTGFVYDGTGKTPGAVVSLGDAALVPGRDYTVAYEGNTNAGTAKAILTGIDPYVGSLTNEFTIARRSIELTSASATKTYDGTPLVRHEASVGGDGFVAGEGATYTYTGSQTVVGSSANTFSYALNSGTSSGNYTITTKTGTLTVTKATAGGGSGGEEPGSGTVPSGGVSKFDANAVYDGKDHTIDTNALVVTFRSVMHGEVSVMYADDDGSNPGGVGHPDGDWSDTASTVRDAGSRIIWYRVTNPNYEEYVHAAQVTVSPKAVSIEMLKYGEDAWFFDGTEKKPDIIVVDGEPNICTENDYTLVYHERTGAGLFPVTVSGRNNYAGTVSAEFAILKRPIAPPVIGSKSYNRKQQTATITVDERWVVVANAGGVDVGEYAVVLQLTNTEDYKWKGLGDDESCWVGTFAITRAGNGWSTNPGIANWTAGETPSEPQMGRPRYGETSYVTYRVRGTAPERGIRDKPTRTGVYTARFVVEESANYAGTYKDVDFEIYPGADDPQDIDDGELQALISLDARNQPEITWRWTVPPSDPNAQRAYTILGKRKLTDAEWVPVTDENKAQMRFFKVRAAR